MPDDYIKRSDAIAKMSELPFLDEEVDIPCAEEVIMKIPAADVAEVRHGRWEVGDYAEPDHHGVCVAHYPGGGLYCTECLHGWKRERVEGFEYCPNCGAKMTKEEA